MYVIIVDDSYVDFIHKDIKPLYEINAYGSVRNKITGKILKPNFNKGYHRYSLRQKNGGTKHIFAHRMVAMSFIADKSKSNLQVNHIDGNKLNNNVSNLEWVTVSENSKHAYRLGLRKSRKGTSSNFNKHTDEFIDFIVDRIKLGYTNAEIRRDLVLYRNDSNLYSKLIYELRIKRKWKHKFEN